MEFVPARKQDASASWAGYFVQLNQTLLRWVSLKEGQELRLEFAEDIDIFEQVLAGETPSKAILEQVKNSGKRITLRSALKCIRNYAHQLEANSRIEIRYVYTSNAECGAEEKLLGFPGGTKGIEVWKRVAGGDLNDRSKLVAALLDLNSEETIQTESRGRDALARVLADKNAALSFLCNFEWNIAGPAICEYRQLAEGAIRGRIKASADLSVESLYNHCIVELLRLICREGVKSLTASNLDKVLKHPLDSDADSRVLTKLDLLTDEIRSGFSGVNLRLDSLSQSISELAATVVVRQSLLDVRTDDDEVGSLKNVIRDRVNRFLDQQNFQGAIDYIDESATVDGLNVNARGFLIWLRAVVLEWSGDRVESLREFVRASEILSHKPTVRAAVATRLFDAGDVEKALDMAQIAYEKDPCMSTASMLAYIYERQERYSDSRRILEKTPVDEGNIDAFDYFMHLALAKTHTGDVQGGHEVLRRAATDAKRGVYAKFQLAETLCYEGQMSGRREMVVEALELARSVNGCLEAGRYISVPEAARMRASRVAIEAGALSLLGKGEDGIAVARAGLEEDYENIVTLVLMLLLTQEGRWEEAAPLLDRLQDSAQSSDPRVWHHLVWRDIEVGCDRKTLEEGIAKFGNCLDIEFRAFLLRSRWLMKNGDCEGARSLAQDALKISNMTRGQRHTVAQILVVNTLSQSPLAADVIERAHETLTIVEALTCEELLPQCLLIYEFACVDLMENGRVPEQPAAWAAKRMEFLEFNLPLVLNQGTDPLTITSLGAFPIFFFKIARLALGKVEAIVRTQALGQLEGMGEVVRLALVEIVGERVNQVRRPPIAQP